MKKIIINLILCTVLTACNSTAVVVKDNVHITTQTNMVVNNTETKISVLNVTESTNVVVTTTDIEESVVEEINYNTAYVETAEKLFYELEGTTDSTTNNIKIYVDDINDDGVLELFCCKSETGMGFTDMYIFDVTTGNTSTFWIGQTNKGIFKYVDTAGVVHYLIRITSRPFTEVGGVYFYDIVYGNNQVNVNIPLELNIFSWYDDGALVLDINGVLGTVYNIEERKFITDNTTELGILCQCNDLDWGTESIYGEDIEAVTKLIDEYVVKDMQLEYELELVAEVERLENGEYEKAWEEIAPAIQELYPV